MSYTDGTVTLKKVTFTKWGENPELSITETHGNGCVVRLGNLETVVKPQDLLSAALFVGAKHIDVNLK